MKVSVEHQSTTLSTVKIDVPIAKKIPFSAEKYLLKALGLKHSVLPVVMYDAGARHVLVSVDCVTTLHTLRPNHEMLAELENLAVNCFTWDGTRVENRMFSPAYGVKEDAGTGSVVGPIALHLLKCGQLKTNERLIIEQGILLNRRCVMYGEIKEEGEKISHVELSGQV
ncbi:PhzF family phenazine biosynthesis protein, partial [Bartonella sp. MU37NMGALS]|uniref:PhzF family phenazine biosynthesis protein n=1 Tax=Bartonella sp. MU37NMGALS TaxID=3243560 RepID=UPI0035CEB2C7